MVLFGSQPVPQANAKFPNAFDPANASGKVSAQKSTVGGFVCETADSIELEVDRA
jgi:hypothetical protein